MSLRGGCERLWWWWWEVGGGGGDGRSKGLCVDRFSRSLKQIELYSRLVVVVGRSNVLLRGSCERVCCCGGGGRRRRRRSKGLCWLILAVTEANRVLLTFCGCGDILKDTG